MIIFEFKEPPNTGKNPFLLPSRDRTKFRFMEICLVLMCRVMPDAASYTEHKSLDGFCKQNFLYYPMGIKKYPSYHRKKK